MADDTQSARPSFWGRSERSQRRDRNTRDAQTIEILELARELRWLAHQYPRFKGKLNQLMMHTRRQASPSKKKRELITAALKHSLLLTVVELAEETLLDKPSLVEELAALERAHQVEVCDRDGLLPLERPRGGLWTAHWRLCGQTSSHRVGATPHNVAGPSGTAPRHG